jgi:hypothetical protein
MTVVATGGGYISLRLGTMAPVPKQGGGEGGVTPLVTKVLCLT